MVVIDTRAEPKLEGDMSTMHSSIIWGKREIREILFESCYMYAVHFSLSRNFVRKLIRWPFFFSQSFVKQADRVPGENLTDPFNHDFIKK